MHLLAYREQIKKMPCKEKKRQANCNTKRNNGMIFINLVITVLLTSGNVVFSNDDFYLIDSCKNSDINYKMIQNIDLCDADKYLSEVFNCVDGKSSIYRFMRKRKIGVDIPMNSLYDTTHISPDSTLKEIIILKVKNGFIVDAYYFHLSLAEGPASAFLLRIRKKMKLRGTIDTQLLNFKPVDNGEDMLSRKHGMLRMVMD